MTFLKVISCLLLVLERDAVAIREPNSKLQGPKGNTNKLMCFPLICVSKDGLFGVFLKCYLMLLY